MVVNDMYTQDELHIIHLSHSDRRIVSNDYRIRGSHWWYEYVYWILKLFTIFMMIVWVGVGISATTSNCETLTPSTGRFMIACWTSSFMSLKHTCHCCWLYHNFWLTESVAPQVVIISSRTILPCSFRHVGMVKVLTHLRPRGQQND